MCTGTHTVYMCTVFTRDLTAVSKCAFTDIVVVRYWKFVWICSCADMKSLTVSGCSVLRSQLICNVWCVHTLFSKELVTILSPKSMLTSGINGAINFNMSSQVFSLIVIFRKIPMHSIKQQTAFKH